MSPWIAGTVLMTALIASPTTAPAVEAGGIEWSGSGFLTLAAGRIVGGDDDNRRTNPAYLGYRGPHLISDWAQGGVYEAGGVRLAPDSRLGLQGSATFSPALSLTAQVVARGARDGKVDLEWLYGTWKASDRLTLQFGRKRLPILYYSESQDVGVSYPWLRLPPDLYGWQVVNYNGANLLWRDQAGLWSYSANLFAGAETNRDTGYQKMYNGKHSRTDVKWTNILGGELTVARDWFEGRLGYFQNRAYNGVPDGNDFDPGYRQRIYTAGVAIDHGPWVLRNEYYLGDLSSVEEKDYAQIYALGYRLGKFLPMLTYATYYTRYITGGRRFGYSHADEERHDTRSLSLRYDLSTSSALKIQFDDYRDRSGAAFRTGGSVAVGNARLIAVSYDLVF